VPSEYQHLAHQRSAISAGKRRTRTAWDISQLDDLRPPCLVSEVHVEDHEGQPRRALDGLFRQRGPELAMLENERPLARTAARGEVFQESQAAARSARKTSSRDSVPLQRGGGGRLIDFFLSSFGFRHARSLLDLGEALFVVLPKDRIVRDFSMSQNNRLGLIHIIPN